MPIYLHIVSGYSGAPKAALSGYNRDRMTHKRIIFIIWSFKKKFADPWSKGKMPVLYKTVYSDSRSVAGDDRFSFFSF